MHANVFIATIFIGLIVATGTRADIYAYRDDRGVVTFTNAPSHSGFRTVLREHHSTAPGSTATPESYASIVRSASGRYGVDPHLVWAVIKVESDFNPNAVSEKGARGLMQLMPATARMHRVANIHDPGENIRAGVRHLRYVLDRFHDNLSLALAAYNAGIKAVERYRSIPPFAETRKYVRRVLKYYRLYRARDTALTGFQLKTVRNP